MNGALRRDASSGDPYACLAMAYFYHTGKETGQNTRLALEWYGKAAELGCARAHWELAKMYRDGENVPADPVLYIAHLRASAELGNPEAQLDLGYEYALGRNVMRDLEECFQWMLKAASQGESSAKFAVGYMFSRGAGTRLSKPDAETWFSSAAITGDGEMFLRIGIGYEFGTFLMERDLLEAARWYKYGVEMGHEKCIICWRAVMETLDGAPQESLESRTSRLMSTASQAEMDAMDSAVAEGDALFEAGDEAGAFASYMRAADMGSPDGMFSAAMMYHIGAGVRRDDGTAVRMLLRAADAGSADAQFYLATAYESGTIPTDDSQIVKLYSDAAYNGFLAAFYYLGKYVDHPEVYVRRTHTRR